MMVTEPSADAFVAARHRTYGRERTMTKLIEGLRTIVALLKAGPGGHPIVTHHHLHKG